MRESRQLLRLLAAMCGVAAVLVLAACGSKSTSSSTQSSTTAKATKGGSITVLEDSAFAGAWPAGLDPGTNTNGAANQAYMNSIFGQIFKINEQGKIVPDLASGYTFEDGGKTVKIKLRTGVKFSDGTPFNANAVVFNIKRDLKSTCTCRPVWPVKSVTAEGDDTVVLNFTAPYAAVIASFVDSNANWTASPTALKKLGEKKFRITPVGAGPFKVVSNKLSSELVLTRNVQEPQAQGHPAEVDVAVLHAAEHDDPALQQPEGAAGDLLRVGLRGDPLAHLQQHVREHPGLHRPGRVVLRADGPRLPHLQPRQGQAARQGARRAEGHTRDDQRARGQGDDPGAADPMAAGRHEGQDRVLRPSGADPGLPVEEVAGGAADGRLV